MAREIPPSPHRPCAHGSSSRLRLATPRGHPRETSRRGRGAMEWAFSGQVGSPLPSFPRARERGANGWGRGASPLGLRRCGHGHCGKPQARASLIQNKRYNNTKRPLRQATSLRQRRPCGRREECPGGARKLRETRRGDGIASRDTVSPDTLIIKTYAKPK